MLDVAEDICAIKLDSDFVWIVTLEVKQIFSMEQSS